MQRRAAAAQRAVAVELDAAHDHPRLRIEPRAAPEPGSEQGPVVAGEEERGAQRQLAGLLRREIGADPGLADAHVGDRGEPHACARRRRAAQPGALLVVGGGRLVRSDEIHRVVDQHSGRLAALIAQDPASGRVGGLRGDAGDGERARVGETGVAVDPPHPHRMIGHRGRERGVARELVLGPAALVPAAAGDPGARRGLAAARDEARDHVFERGGIAEVHLAQLAAQPEQVGVGVDQAGGHGAARELDHLSARPAQPGGAGIGTQVEDAACPHRQGPRHPARRRDGVEHPAAQQEVGRVLSGRRRRTDHTQDRPHDNGSAQAEPPHAARNEATIVPENAALLPGRGCVYSGAACSRSRSLRWPTSKRCSSAPCAPRPPTRPSWSTSRPATARARCGPPTIRPPGPSARSSPACTSAAASGPTAPPPSIRPSSNRRCGRRWRRRGCAPRCRASPTSPPTPRRSPRAASSSTPRSRRSTMRGRARCCSRWAGAGDQPRLRWSVGQIVVVNSRGVRREARVTAVELEARSGRGPAAGRAAGAARTLAGAGAGCDHRARPRPPRLGGARGARRRRARGVALGRGHGGARHTAQRSRLHRSRLPRRLVLPARPSGHASVRRALHAARRRHRSRRPALSFRSRGHREARRGARGAGTPRTPALDQRHAALLGLPATGHASAGDDARAENLFLLAGEAAETDLAAAAEGGIFAGAITAAEVYDPRRMQVRLRFSGARRVAAAGCGEPLPDLIWEGACWPSSRACSRWDGRARGCGCGDRCSAGSSRRRWWLRCRAARRLAAPLSLAVDFRRRAAPAPASGRRPAACRATNSSSALSMRSRISGSGRARCGAQQLAEPVERRTPRRSGDAASVMPSL